MYIYIEIDQQERDIFKFYVQLILDFHVCLYIYIKIARGRKKKRYDDTPDMKSSLLVRNRIGSYSLHHIELKHISSKISLKRIVLSRRHHA